MAKSSYPLSLATVSPRGLVSGITNTMPKFCCDTLRAYALIGKFSSLRLGPDSQLRVPEAVHYPGVGGRKCQMSRRSLAWRHDDAGYTCQPPKHRCSSSISIAGLAFYREDLFLGNTHRFFIIQIIHRVVSNFHFVIHKLCFIILNNVALTNMPFVLPAFTRTRKRRM